MGKIFQSIQVLNENGIDTVVKDILIEKGKISACKKNIPVENHEVIDAKGWIAAPAFKDCFTVVSIPGNEHKENAQGLAKSAHAGGYSELLLISGGSQAIDKASELRNLQFQFNDLALKINIAGCISENQKGEEITEMYDMHLAGAQFFSDGIQNIKNPELLKRALLYTQTFDGKLMVYSEDHNAANHGMINESETSAALGLKVRPALAEEIAVVRNIYIAEYTQRNIHLSGISSAKSVELIKNAKKRGIPVTADTTIANVFFNDEVLNDFDTKYKVLPVLRDKKNQKALWKGVLDGTIDLVNAGHHPQDIESKDCEFDLAAFGGVTLEASAAALWSLLKGDAKMFYELMIQRPAKYLNSEVDTIKTGNKADLCFFTLEDKVYDKSAFKGTSKTSPFNDEKLPLNIQGFFFALIFLLQSQRTINFKSTEN